MLEERCVGYIRDVWEEVEFWVEFWVEVEDIGALATDLGTSAY